MRKDRYVAIVIYPDPGIKDIRAVASKEAQRRLGTKQTVDIAEMIYSSLHELWIAIFPIPKERD